MWEEQESSINGNNLWLHHDLVRNHPVRFIAAVVAHEIMHNRGWSHKKNDYGSTYYSNTIPNQIEACVFNFTPNPSKGPKTVIWNEEFCHGPVTRNHGSRRRMHACPVGTYMAGVHLGANEFLCSSKPHLEYSEEDEIIRKSGDYSEFGMAACPKGYAMTGLHEGNNWLLCAPYPTSSRSRDVSTARAGMHTCPKHQVMAGIHAGNNHLTCQQ